MKMNWWKILGVLFFVKGAILFLLFYYGMTGFVVMENISSRTGSVLALALVIGGVLIFMAGKRGTPDYATAILEQRRYIDSARKLARIATRSGYQLEGGFKEGTRVTQGGDVITVIPNHRKVSRGVSRSILEALSSGISSFRRTS